MHTPHHTHHSLESAQKRKHLRAVLDVVIVVIALVLGFLLVLGHLSEQRQERMAINRERAMHALAQRMPLPMASGTPELVITRAQGATPEDLMVVSSPPREEVISPSSREIPPPGNPVVLSTTTQSETPSSTSTSVVFPRYEDVTAYRFHHPRIGVVMELPSDWVMVSERTQDILLSLRTVPPQSRLDRVVREPDAMWIHIEKPCTDTTATSTRFIFATTTDIGIRQATSCVAPLLVTLGYRADAPDPSGRERFLLSVGRTLLPVVP